jgi:hypothetical protein
VKFQRAAEGHPLDDVIVHAHDARGNLAILEIQVKRSITFTPSDPVFRAVVTQIAQAASLPDFQTSRNELAIATARTSRKIDGAYQDVVTWARHLLSAATFFGRIERPGSAMMTCEDSCRRSGRICTMPERRTMTKQSGSFWASSKSSFSISRRKVRHPRTSPKSVQSALYILTMHPAPKLFGGP